MYNKQDSTFIIIYKPADGTTEECILPSIFTQQKLLNWENKWGWKKQTEIETAAAAAETAAAAAAVNAAAAASNDDGHDLAFFYKRIYWLFFLRLDLENDCTVIELNRLTINNKHKNRNKKLD